MAGTPSPGLPHPRPPTMDPHPTPLASDPTPAPLWTHTLTPDSTQPLSLDPHCGTLLTPDPVPSAHCRPPSRTRPPLQARPRPTKTSGKNSFFFSFLNQWRHTQNASFKDFAILHTIQEREDTFAAVTLAAYLLDLLAYIAPCIEVRWANSSAAKPAWLGFTYSGVSDSGNCVNWSLWGFLL